MMKRKIIIVFLLTNIGLIFSQNQNEKIVFKNELAQIIQTNDSIKISNNFFESSKVGSVIYIIFLMIYLVVL